MLAGMDSHADPPLDRTGARYRLLPPLLPLEGFGGTLDAVLHAIAGERNLLELAAILEAGVVFQPEFDRIHPQFFSDDIHVNFLCERCLWMTDTSHVAAVRVVGIDGIALTLHVWAAVDERHDQH